MSQNYKFMREPTRVEEIYNKHTSNFEESTDITFIENGPVVFEFVEDKK